MSTRDMSDLYERIRFRGDPIAHPESIVVSGNARFTALTRRLVRLEWSETGRLEDRGTWTFPTRYTPLPVPLSVQTDGNVLVIDTGGLVVKYDVDSGAFTADNLSVSFVLEGENQTWTPGTPNSLNLRGTRRTLDMCAGDAALDEGILSRAGWALFDDSRSVVFEQADGWVAPRSGHALQDWYFFGYGHDYRGALAEYTRLAGEIPLIPRFVLGAWWSRYWAYSDQDLKDLVREFEEHDIPLDVLVIDMDWHTPHAWTGYTWNRELFPDPPAFLRWVHDKGLRATLNLHPAQGVQHFEDVYPRFAEAMGVDPTSKEPIPFRITDKRFVENYFGLLHHPMEEQGVDFWWMDWQQGESSEMKGLDPLLWINHLHFRDSVRRGGRPMLYSRWGGLGNHRYPIGFSGDTFATWPALQFQPFFTATASNVAYGWWSHDIGGHMGGATEPELYARWVQFGALSPCLRLHSTKDPLAERRPWKYPDEVYQAARAAFLFRYQLVPYLYTMARIASDTSVSLCRPMYYEYPEQDAAYAARYQYFLGDQAIAAPIVHPCDPETGLAATDVWVPEGTWIDYATKETFVGPRWVRIVGDLNRMPLLVRAGGILPMAPQFRTQEPPRLASGTTDALPRDWLILSVFPGREGSFCLYEDDGTSEAYREGELEWTEIKNRVEEESTWTVEISPTQGHCRGLPVGRGYTLLLEGSHQPEVVIIDEEETADWEYRPETLTTIIHVPRRDKRKPVKVTAFASTRTGRKLSALGEDRNRALVLSDVRKLLGDRLAPGAQDVDALVDVVFGQRVPGQLDAIARLGGPFARIIEFVAPNEAAQQLGRVIVGAPERGEPYDLKVTFALSRGGKKTQHTVEVEHTTDSLILDTPFAFEGVVETMQWEAEVEITWRGQRFTVEHQSSILFPAIPAWRAVVYNEEENPIALDQVMDDTGKVSDVLDWKAYVQTVEGIRNVNGPHAVILAREYRECLKAGEPLAGYLVATITSPDERDAAFRFRAGGEVVIYVNGREIEVLPEQEDADVAPMFRRTRRTETIRLRAGENTLVIDSKPPRGTRPFWILGGAIVTPGDDPMIDLAYE